MPAAAPADVIVAGGGPAGSTIAWDLARRGLRVVVLERASFPREKVCGDYVDPRGIVILRAMGASRQLQRTPRGKVTRTATFVDWERHYSGPIPFYGDDRRPAAARAHDPARGAGRSDARSGREARARRCTRTPP